MSSRHLHPKILSATTFLLYFELTLIPRNKKFSYLIQELLQCDSTELSLSYNIFSMSHITWMFCKQEVQSSKTWAYIICVVFHIHKLTFCSSKVNYRYERLLGTPQKNNTGLLKIDLHCASYTHQRCRLVLNTYPTALTQI